jgi:hypothetical protein
MTVARAIQASVLPAQAVDFVILGYCAWGCFRVSCSGRDFEIEHARSSHPRAEKFHLHSLRCLKD